MNNTTNPRERALSYAKFLREQLRRTDIGSETTRYLQIEQLKLLQRRHDLYKNVRLSPDEVGIPEKYLTVKIPTCDALADCRGCEADPFGKAEAYGRKLERRWINARTMKERASIEEEVNLLSHGLHPRFPGVEIEELLQPELTCDRKVNTMPTRTETFDDDDDVALIMNAIQNMNERLDKVEQHPQFRAATRGPGMSPRTLNPQQAYQAHLTAYTMSQAKRSQRIAHEAGFAPPLPEDAIKEAKEQHEATRDFNPAAYERSLQTAKAHRSIARTGHLTFADANTLARNARQNSEPRKIRDTEAALMRNMIKQIHGE